MNKLFAIGISVFGLAGISFGQDVDFEKDVLPVLEKKCMGCHRADYKDPRTGRPKKAKSGYRMDTAALIMKGGDENYANIQAGKPDSSPTYKYTTLPEDEDFFMPPKGDALTDAEKAKLKAWIAAGAKTGKWKETIFNADGTKKETKTN